MIVKIIKNERILKELFEYYRNNSRYKVIYKSVYIISVPIYILHILCLNIAKSLAFELNII